MLSFNPYDSDTWPDETAPSPYDQDEPPFPTLECPPQQDEQPLSSPVCSDMDSEYSDEDPHVASDPSTTAIHMTDLENIRTVLSVITRYPGGVLSTHLKKFNGLIVLPLEAVTMLRKPLGRHTNPHALLYVPIGPKEEFAEFDNFNEAVRLLYQNTQ